MRKTGLKQDFLWANQLSLNQPSRSIGFVPLAFSITLILLLQAAFIQSAYAEIPDTGFEYDGGISDSITSSGSMPSKITLPPSTTGKYNASFPVLQGSTTKIRDLRDEEGGNTWNNDWQAGESLIQRGRVVSKIYVPTQPSTVKGNLLNERYQLEAARSQYEKTLAKDPTNAGALNGLGRIYYQMTTSSNQDIRNEQDNLMKEAIAHYIAALRYQPNYVEARVNLAEAYLEQGRLRDAQEELSIAMRLAPTHSEVLEKMGVLTLKKGDVNGSVSYLESAVASKSGNHSAHYYLGVAYTLRGEYSRALTELQTALYQYPNSAPVHHQMGVVYAEQGNGGAAVNEFKKAITIKPELIPANLALAEHYRRRGDFSESLEVMKNLLESYPNNWDLKFQVAEMSLINQQPEVAAAQYRDILQEEPNNKKARAGLSQAEERIAKTQASEGTLISKVMARQTIASATQVDGTNLDARLRQVKLNGGLRETSQFGSGESAAVWNGPSRTPGESLTRGEVLLANKRFGEARQEFQVALNTFNGPQDTLKIGEMLLDFGLPDEATQAFRRVLSQNPQDPVAQLGIKEALKVKRQARGLILESAEAKRDKSPARAISLLDQALLLDQTNADAYYKLGELYEQVKRYDLAVEHYELFLKLSPTGDEAEQARRRISRLNNKLAQR
jgi:tetratricopeptide (TPR) repeat protein